MKHFRKLCIVFGIVLILAGVFGIVLSILSNQKFKLDDDQFGSSEFVDISGEEYENLISERKSFLVFVDQDGCITADDVESFAREIMNIYNVKVYRIMFSDVRKISLHDDVKYYPSFVIVHQGNVKSWLKTDSDEDVDRFNNSAAFKNWLDDYIAW